MEETIKRIRELLEARALAYAALGDARSGRTTTRLRGDARKAMDGVCGLVPGVLDRLEELEANGEAGRPTIASGWTMPESPAQGLVPVAYNVGGCDGWHLYWADALELNEPWGGGDADIPWPFGPNDFAKDEDMKRAGFVCAD